MDYSSLSGVPRFLTRPKAFMVSVGKDATLSCQIIGNPIPVVSWEKDKLPVQSGGRFKTTEDGDLYRLTIYDLNLEDSGQYICRAKNTIGEAFAAVSIKVGEETTVTEFAPYFIQKPSNIKVTLGEDAMFKCKVQGSPPLSVNWEKDGRYLRNKADAGRFQIESAGESNALTIQCARLGDSGTYTCRAENLLGSASASAALVMDISHGTLDAASGARNATFGALTRTCSVTEGKHAKLSCYVTGEPKPVIVWKKDNEVILEGRRHVIYEDDQENFVLKILFCKQTDNGLYTCTASNLAGQTYSSVLVTVKEPSIPFKAKLRDLEVREKESATFQCEVPVAATETAWFKEETKLQQSKKYNIEEEGTYRRLTVQNVTADDDAVYICEMKEGSRTIAELSVQGNIIKKLPRKTAIFVNDTATFCVELDSDCQDVRWLKNKEEVKPSDRISITRSGKQHTMTIRECKVEDAGEIAFLADESRTSTQFTVTTPKKPPTQAPADPVVKNKTETSVTLAWSPPRMDRPIPIDGYIVERKKLTGFTWVRCHESHVPVPELTVSHLPEEADYQFRVSAVNAYGQSPFLEFPGSLHLEPILAVRTPLTAAEVAPGGDALFTVDLTKVCSGTWYLNGKVLQESETHIIQRTQTTHTLIIKNVTKKDDGAEVRFVANDIDTSTKMRVKAPGLTSLFDCNSLAEVSARLREEAKLQAELSDAEATVKWMKDGKELKASEKYEFQTVGKRRILKICSTAEEDAGAYECVCEGDKMIYQLSVKALANFINKEKTGGVIKATAGKEAEFVSETSEANIMVKWYKEGKEITASKKFTLEDKGKVHKLVASAVTKEDEGTYTCKIGDDTLTFDLKVSGKFVQKEVKAALSENATLSCEVAQEKTEVKWCKDGKLITTSKKFKVESEGKSRRLVVGEVEKKDAGQYTCEAAGQKLTFRIDVTEPEVVFTNKEKVQKEVKAALSENATLSCEVAQEKTEVKWYKDGKLITSSKKFKVESEGKSRRLVVSEVEKKDAGEYTCEAAGQKLTFRINVPGRKRLFSPSFLFLESLEKLTLFHNFFCVTLQIFWRTTLAWPDFDGCKSSSSKTLLPEVVFTNKEKVQKEVKAALSENATLSCEVAQEKTEVKWYKDGKLITSSKKFKVESEGKSRRLVVGEVEKKDAGEYTCEAAGQKLTFRIDVTGSSWSFLFLDTAQFWQVEKVQKEVKAVLTESATLVCEVAQDTTEVKWFKDGKLLVSSRKFKIETVGKSRRLVIEQLEKKDAGEYICEAAGQKLAFKLEPTGECSLCGKEPLVVQEHESITLTTSVTPETAVVRWFKDGTEIKASKKCVIRSEGAARTLTVSAAESADSALYSCQTKDDKQEFRVQVKEVPVKFAKKLEAVKAEIGGSVSLSCELSHAKGKVTWSRNGVEIKPSKRFQIREEGLKRTLTITGLRAEDEGEYSCESRDDKSTPRVVKFVTSLNSVVSEEGREAVFKCTVTPGDAVVTWLRNGTKIEASKKYVISQKDTSHSLTITDLTLEDAAEITASAEGVESTANLRVREASISFKKKLEPRTVEERETVTLEVELTKASEVKWMRNSIVLKPSDKIEIKAEGTKHTLVVKDISFADRGFYCCESTDDKTQAKINVEMRQIKLVRGLQPMEVAEKGTVTFEVEVSHEDVEGTWQKDGVRLKPAPNVSFGLLGKKHSLTLSSVALEDAGLISFKAEGINTSGRLTVTELPVRISKPLADVSVTQKLKATFECELSKPNANVKWFKDGKEIRQSKNIGFISQGNKRSLIIHKCEYEDQGTYTCQAAEDKTSATLKVHGKTYSLTYARVHVEDAAEIKFVAEKAESRAQLTVKELPVKIVKPLRDKIALWKHRGVLECQVSRANAKVRWFKKNVEIHPSAKYEIVSEGVYRKLIINDADYEDEDSYTCDAFDDKTSANFFVEEQAINIVKELNDEDVTEPEEANFECETSIPSVKPAKWFLKGAALQAGRNIIMQQEGTIHRLTIIKTSVDMTGTIQFSIGKSKSTANLLVRDYHIQITRKMEDKTVLERHSVILSCDFRPSPKHVRWFKGQELIEPSDKYRIKRDQYSAELKIMKVKPEDAGVYKCQAGIAETEAMLSVEARNVEVLKHLQDVEIEEDSSAVFSCELSHDDEDVEWFLNGTLLYTNNLNEIKNVGKCYTLTMKQVKPEDAGTVTMKSDKVSESVRLKVIEKPVVFMKSLDDVFGEERGVIKLECEVSKEKVKPVWKKDGVKIASGNKYEEIQAGKSLCLLIHDLEKTDAGLYTCDIGTDVAKSKVSVQELNIGITKRLKNTEIQEGGDCTFECILSHESIDDFSWMLNGRKLESGGRFKASNTGRKYTLSIKNVVPGDTGEVIFTARGLTSKASLVVKEKPTEITKQLEDKTSPAGQDISLSCELSKADVNIRWYKDGKAIRKSQKYELQQEGTRSILIIHDSTVKDSGEYTCETESSKTTARITVQEKPNYFVKELSDLKVDESGTAVFVCQSERAPSSVVWRKGIAELRVGRKYEMQQKGQILQLTIKNLEKSDSDTYSCDIGDAQSRAKLTVQEAKKCV
uniref:Obscurin n=1 Tax=Malurus cyaneus samueli TaxID=2593467 RepID=A0A8C5TWT4_9PASS